MVGEPAWQQAEHDQCRQQHLGPQRVQAQPGDPLVADGFGAAGLIVEVVTSGGVTADALGRQQATVGQEADLPECGKVVEPFADPEVASVVDRGLGPKGAVELVVLLDLGVLVVDVQRWLHAVVEHPGPKPPRGGLDDAAAEEERDAVGPSGVQVVAAHLLEEDPAGKGAVQDLGAGELGLQDGDVVAVAGGAVSGAERVRQRLEPRAAERVDALVVRGRRRSAGAGWGRRRTGSRCRAPGRRCRWRVPAAGRSGGR